ncbi:MAG: Bacillopeptidase F precursor [Verrucomicrobia bacterium ADurb.Bin345]|nr:MAG: Bacillopeptidase F precursor [Verrucomicrobia bacterium ADurb.Bin345]
MSGSNGIWKTYSADLAAWAGSAVRIRFFFDTADAMYNQFEGWMVDDVEVATRSGARRDVFEDDMTDTTNWVSGGLWRLTTDRSASGPQSWVYNDGDDYSTGARSQGSILSPWLDLSRASSAQLSFKSWYETEDEGTTWDRKQVLASTNGTAWTRIHLVSGPSEEWTTEQVDLSAYAGGQVRLRFHFDSVDGQNNGFEGWYVDDVQVTAPEGLGAQVFSEGAEESTNTLTMSGLWHQASDLASAGSYSWAYNDGTDFDTGGPNSGELVTRWIDLMAGSGAALQFKSWYETEDSGTAWDRKLVYITTNGEDWVQLRQVTGPMRAWTAQTVDLSPYAGGRIRLKFLFDSVDGTHNQYRGWYLDEITVRLVGRDFAFFESFEDPAAYATNWTREAGAGNWDLSHDTLRAWRIGNDDNIVGGGDGSWSNYIVSADIRYDRQGPYFSDAELYVRYQDRNNYVKVGIRNFYEFWRLKYTVRVDTNFVEQGWIHSFSKTNRPIEGAWYNLKVRAETNTFTVYFDGENVGSFSTAHFPAGRIAVGSQAAQLGIWEPQRGYYFIDDDEYAFWSANEGEIVTLGTPLNLDWGYLKTFFPMLILPGTYVMSDTEVANVCAWITNGFFSLMATDGGVAKLDENGDPDPGRIESVFGVDSTMHALEGLGYAEIGTNIHYTTLDYAPEQVVELDGSANAWSKLGQGLNLATMHAGSTSAPAFICNVLTQRMDSPPKVFCFNYAVDTGGQLTNESRWVAQRALEWLQSQTYMLQLELKYVLVPTNPNLDIVVFSTNFWTLNGWGTNDITVNIPMDNCMTGTNLYWVLFTYPWDATNAWMTHRGFYSAANDGIFTTLDGIGLQLLGITDVAYAGRDWDMWVAYNTQGSNLLAHFGLKKRGQLRQEDNFNDGAADGWTITTNANIEWAATNSAVRATVVGAGGYAWIARDGLSITGQNITVEYDVRFAGGATNAGDGGVVFRGVPLGVTPGAAGWRAGVTNLYTNNLPVTGVWHHVMLSVRDGDPWLRSDLLVDGKVVFLNEPIESTNWGAPVLALLSPYHGGCVEWDNFRVADEEYSLTTQSVSGVFSPMEEGNFWGSLPDYDPDKWEFDGTALGGRYEWYIYFKGEGVNAYKRGGVFFAPRLMVEDEDFPADFYAGDTVFVPVEWENLGTNELPAYLTLNLQNPYADQMYTTNTFLVTNGWGSMLCEVAVPEDMPSAGDYQWSAYLYPTGAANGWLERIGSDDTFRFSPQGTPVGPETVIWVRAATGEQFAGYSDLGIPEPENMAYFTWSGAHDGDYTGIAVPEGDKCWKADVTGTYAGWGVFHTNGLKDLSGFNYLKFWVKTEERSLKIQIEAPQSVQWTLYLDQMGWDAANAGLWQEITVPITNFGFATPPTNVYGSFLATLEFLPSLRYSLRSLDNSTTWVVGDGGGTTHGLNIKCTTNGGARWAGVPATNFALTTWYNVDFVDANRGWAVGGLNIIAGTTNAGQSWTLLTNGLPFNNYWYALEFINSQTGWACGSTSIVMTTDGGATWTNQFGASNIVRAIRFSDEKKGWACGNNLLLTTTNGGTTWTYSPVPTPGVYWRDLFFVNSSTGWACGYSGLVCRTTDSGNTWELAAGVPALTNQYLYAMTWASESNGWMVGSGVDTNNMYFTRDGGASWSNANSGLSATLLDVEFSDANHGFAVGQSAYIMATTNGAAATPTWTHALPNARTFYIDNTRWTVNP